VLPGGFAQLEQELRQLLSQALERNGLSPKDLHRGVFGMAGADTRRQSGTIRDILTRWGMENPLVINDAYLPVKAASQRGYGIGAINGSGSTVAGIGADGSMLQIGGCGGLTGDIGGGSYLGEAAVRAAYKAMYKGAPPTLLQGMLFERLGVQREQDFLEALTEAREAGELRLSDLNRLRFEAARQGDKVALGILARTGEDSAMAICRCWRGCPTRQGSRWRWRWPGLCT
jgi:N-acetylglucosamine kinase-like BadF-type ATPase